MNIISRVQVPSKGDHLDRSEPQLRKGDRPWGGSGKRRCGSMNKNRVQAALRGASGLPTAKLRWSIRSAVYAAIVHRRMMFLPEEISPYA